MKAYTKQLTRERVAEVLRQHDAITPLARELGKHRVTVSQVVNGRTTSRAIMRAAEARARKILAARKEVA